ncbi:MAG: TIGR04053 family radical SAM/SPASM domain-containing protein [Thermoguttaceae bacterium]|nr:TIGR04053 family radical SAM/SPASM domain-containing protein [Thermoguttaceae bacterium]
MRREPYTVDDFTKNPLMFYYEVTRACDLVCKHCRASAQESAAPDELSHENAIKLMEDVARFPRKPTICFTGGDPLKRADLFEIIRAATDLGIGSALTPSATPLATFDAFKKAKEAGVSAIGISIDGPNAEVHDAFRGFAGSFAKALDMLKYARDLELPVQVNTSITKRNAHLIDEIADMLEETGVMMWSVFFLVPVGRGVEETRISPQEYREVFAKLYQHSQTKPFSVKTTEAPHYRRFVLEHGGDPLAAPKTRPQFPKSAFANAMKTEGRPLDQKEQEGLEKVGQGRRSRAPLGVTDGRGIMFVGHNGEIFPAGFLPIVCGRFPQDSVVDVYQKHPLFNALQNPDNYKGICGACQFRHICGGSRARAYAVYGDPLAAEPDCDFEK